MDFVPFRIVYLLYSLWSQSDNCHFMHLIVLSHPLLEVPQARETDIFLSVFRDLIKNGLRWEVPLIIPLFSTGDPMVIKL